MMRTLNPRHVASLIPLINASPYFVLLSLRVSVIEYGCCKLHVDLEEKHLNLFGGLHGGVYASAIDSAAYWAVYGGVGEQAGLVSIDLHVDNIAAVRSGKLLVEGRQVKAGRTLCFSQAFITDEDGKLLAQGTSKLLVTDGLQTLDQAFKMTGCAPLPAKFL
jgi:uncharacterized protein (TIGR00369 family)